MYVPERVRRIAEEEAARALRLALHRRAILAAVCATWPVDPSRRSEAEWRALRAALPAGTSAAEIRNRTRQVRAHLAEHGSLPAEVTEVEGAPVVAAQVLLAAADKQLLTLARATTAGLAGGEVGTAVPGGPDTAVLRVKLPLCAAPVSRADWAWHVIAFTVPPHVPAHADWCAPTLRVAAHRLRVDLPFTVPVPTASAVGHRVGLGLDWGVNTLLTGTVARLIDPPGDSTGTPNSGCAGGPGTGPCGWAGGLRWADAALRRDRDLGEAAPAARPARTPGRQTRSLRRVAVGVVRPGPRSGPTCRTATPAPWSSMSGVCARIRRLNRALAWSAARWAVDQAIATGASVIYLEDLATLEARGRRKGNARAVGAGARSGGGGDPAPGRQGRHRGGDRSGAGHLEVLPALRHRHQRLKHVAAPDRPNRPGWKWARCSCGLSADRDWAAAERIVARGLLGQAHTRTDRATGHRTITTVVEGNVSRARRPRAETRRVRRANRTGRDTFTRPGLSRSYSGQGPAHPQTPRAAPPGPPRMVGVRPGSHRLLAVCRSGVRFPPPPRWDSVRRDTNPRAATPWGATQVVHAISSTGPVSTAPAPPPSCASARTTDPRGNGHTDRHV